MLYRRHDGRLVLDGEPVHDPHWHLCGCGFTWPCCKPGCAAPEMVDQTCGPCEAISWDEWIRGGSPDYESELRADDLAVELDSEIDFEPSDPVYHLPDPGHGEDE